MLISTETTGNDDPAVSVQGLADRLERFLFGLVDKAAGIHDDQRRVFIGRRDVVTLETKLCEDPLGIDQCLGAAEADETDTRRSSHPANNNSINSEGAAIKARFARAGVTVLLAAYALVAPHKMRDRVVDLADRMAA